MFSSLYLSETVSADRQARFRHSAQQRRFVLRNKAPAVAGPPPGILSVIWPDDPDYLPSQERAHCAA